MRIPIGEVKYYERVVPRVSQASRFSVLTTINGGSDKPERLSLYFFASTEQNGSRTVFRSRVPSHAAGLFGARAAMGHEVTPASTPARQT